MINKKTRIIRMLVFSTILITIMLLVPQTISLLRGGFGDPNILRQFQFYEIAGIGFLIGISLLFFIELLITKGDDKYGNSLGFVSLGGKPGASFFKRFTIFQLTLLSFIIFSSLGLISFLLKKQSFTGLAVLPQQFTAFDSTIFSAALIPVAENLGAAFVIALFIFTLRVIARKTNMNSVNFMIFSILICLIVGLFGVGWHNSVYPDSETAQLVVFGFWTMGGFLTIISGSFVLFWVMHMINNLIIDLSRFFSNEIVLIIAGGIIVASIFLYYAIYKGKLFGKNEAF